MAEHPQTPAPSSRRIPRAGTFIRRPYPPQAVVEREPARRIARAVAAIQAAAEGLWEYPPFLDDELRSALAAHHGRGLTPDHFVTGNSGCDVLNLIARAFLVPGDEAVICPHLPIYETTARRRAISSP